MFVFRYRKMVASCAALAVAALLLTLVLTQPGPAKPRPAPRPPSVATASSEVCSEAIKPGNYATTINIHNPSAVYTVDIYAKAVQDGGTPSTITGPVPLSADAALEINCRNIGSLLEIGNGYATFSKGFVVIFASGAAPAIAAAPLLPLDVVGVYSAEPPQVTGNQNYPSVIPGIALQLLNIAPRLESVPSGIGNLPAGQYYEYSAKFLCGEAPIEPAPCPTG
jgi:hypothetical protein